MGPYASLYVLIHFYGLYWVLMCGAYKSLLACLHVHFWEPVLSSSA